MKKSEAIERIADETGLSRADAKKALHAIIGVLRTVGTECDRLTLPNLGTFVGKERKARPSRNPATGSYILVPEKKVLRFKMSKSLDLS
ncbi:HU family DNA-binding protein [Stakelama marina]|uniref:HU family DNA-binding protein n=1 Tax=Stakelama marina TaxID=2826939 RepID=A0A8T4ID27_9SPHN|nr:HU family DNA-binding protein [Stakelama marina]